jgi:hypothetical protein
MTTISHHIKVFYLMQSKAIKAMYKTLEPVEVCSVNSLGCESSLIGEEVKK